MTPKRIHLKDATDQQIRTYIDTVLQVPVATNAGRNEMCAAILRADPSGEITLLEEDRAPKTDDDNYRAILNSMNLVETMKPLKGTGPAYKTDPLVVITIARSEEKGGDEPVPLGVNGKRFDVMRGVPVEIPWRYFLVLRQCIKTVYHQVSVNEPPIGRDVPMYPFNIQAMPPREEIEAWHIKDAENQLAA